MRFNRLTATALGVAAFATVAPAAHAQVPAFDFSGENGNFASVTSTRGYSFDVTGAGFTVTYLSFYDFDADGLAESHDVGLWDPAGNLLASVNVPSGTAAPLDATGKFRGVDISPVFLPVGTGYTVGALFVEASGDLQAQNWSSSSTAADIAFTGGRVENNGVNALTQPTGEFSTGYPGGSFGGVSGAVAAAAPEPTAGLLALASLPFAGGLLRKRRV